MRQRRVAPPVCAIHQRARTKQPLYKTKVALCSRDAQHCFSRMIPKVDIEISGGGSQCRCCFEAPATDGGKQSGLTLVVYQAWVSAVVQQPAHDICVSLGCQHKQRCLLKRVPSVDVGTPLAHKPSHHSPSMCAETRKKQWCLAITVACLVDIQPLFLFPLKTRHDPRKIPAATSRKQLRRHVSVKGSNNHYPSKYRFRRVVAVVYRRWKKTTGGIVRNSGDNTARQVAATMPSNTQVLIALMGSAGLLSGATVWYLHSSSKKHNYFLSDEPIKPQVTGFGMLGNQHDMGRDPDYDPVTRTHKSSRAFDGKKTVDGKQ
eukprot:m.311460 g.311460  ORF g.311460 m.311460 type:complete len:318 (+) comp19653_c0_seq2:1325-2278(+)